MRRLSRREVWTLLGVTWIVAAVATSAIVRQTKPLIPVVHRDSPRVDPPRADWLVGSWSWESHNPDVRYVETFAADGHWTLSAKGFTPKTPTSAWWEPLRSPEGRCLVWFRAHRNDEMGTGREFVIEGPDTIQEQTGNRMNLKRFTRVKDAK